MGENKLGVTRKGGHFKMIQYRIVEVMVSVLPGMGLTKEWQAGDSGCLSRVWDEDVSHRESVKRIRKKPQNTTSHLPISAAQQIIGDAVD